MGLRGWEERGKGSIRFCLKKKKIDKRNNFCFKQGEINVLFFIYPTNLTKSNRYYI